MSFLGALGAVGRLLPGYMQGERQAIQDNWNDLKNYNAAQAGQLQNMFDENAMKHRLNILQDRAIEEGYQREAMGDDLMVKNWQLPLVYLQTGSQIANWPIYNQLRHQLTLQQAGMAMNPRLAQQQANGGQQGNLLRQAALGGLGGGLNWQYGLGGGFGYGGYGLGSRGGYGMMPSRY